MKGGGLLGKRPPPGDPFAPGAGARAGTRGNQDIRAAWGQTSRNRVSIPIAA